MHVLLIRPGVCGSRMLDALQPLSIGALAAHTPEHIQVSFIDDSLGEVYEGPEPDLVAITTQTFSALRAYDLAREFRSKKIPVVLGGYHPTLMAREAVEYADAIVVGDVEHVWKKVLDDAVKRKLQQVYYADHNLPLDNIFIDRAIFEGKKYPKIELVLFTRGCRFSCDFCAIKSFYKNVRTRKLDAFATELSTLNKNRILFVVDDNIYANREIFSDVLVVLRNSGMRWVCQVSIDVAADERLVAEMARSGCIMVTIGFESLNKETLKQIGKSWNNGSGLYREVVACFHRYGIGIYGTFVFGYDSDTPDTIKRAFDFAMSSKLEIANFNPLTPMPGSRLYSRLLREGRLLHPTWWLDREYRYGDPIFTPKSMDAILFAEKCFTARKSFYEWGAITRRLFVTDNTLGWFKSRAYFLANVISRREITRKQNTYLGGQ